MNYTGTNAGLLAPPGGTATTFTPLAWMAVALAAAAVAIFWGFGLMPLLNPDEGRNASIAWEMQQAGTWLVPSYNGLSYLDKPAFFFKASGLLMSLFGHSASAARLPSALFAVGTLALVFAFCRREYGIGTAILAVAVVGTTPLFFGFARYVIFDMTLAFFVCGAVFAGYFAESAGDERTRARWSALSAGAMGLAALVKGPVGFIVPLLVLGVFHRVDRNRGALKRLLCGRNVLLFLAIFLPWFIGASLQRHDLPYYGIVFESLQRFATAKAHRTQPFYFYLWVIPATMLFWGLLLPQTLAGAWKNRSTLARPDRLLIVWAVTVTVFFSVSQSKLPGYVLSGVIALGMLVARRVAIAFETGDTRFLRAGGVMLAVITFTAAAGLVWYFNHPQWLDGRIRLYGRDAEDVVAALHPLALPTAVALTAVAGAALCGALTGGPRAIFLAFVVCPLALIVLDLPVFAAAKQHSADEQLARHIERAAPGAEVACYRCFPPGIPFYLRRDITVLTAEDGAEIPSNYVPFMLRRSAQWPEHVQRSGNLAPWLARQRKPVLLLATDKERAVLEDLAAARPAEVLAMAGGRYWGLLVRPAGQ